MNRFGRAGFAALALVTATAAPLAGAHATPPPPVAAVSPELTVVAGFWVVGFMLCTGMTFGKQDVLAARAGTVVTGAERFNAFVKCLLPPIGLAELVR